MTRMAANVGATILATGLIPDSAKTLKPPFADFYVAINGNDAWSGKLAEPTLGKTDGPFRTLERARDAVRKLAASGTARGITVLVRGGVYTFGQTFTLEAQDSGTEEAPVVFQAYPGEKVVLSGGPTVPPDAFRRKATRSGSRLRADFRLKARLRTLLTPR